MEDKEFIKRRIYKLLLNRSISCSHFVDHPTEAAAYLFNQATAELKKFCREHKLDYKRVIWLSDKPASWIDDKAIEQCRIAA